jgi:sec-independent protein translocase protein TatC
MDIGMFFAIIVTAPLFIYNVYSFLKPGLLPKERRFFIILIPIGLLLFVTGFLYGFVALYYSLALIASINVGIGVVNLWDIRYFVSSMFITSALLGIVFQFPIILTFLVRMGVMNIDYMKKKRYEAFIMIFAFVSLLPPTDGLSLIIMSVPLVAMYEFIILFNTRRDTLT